MECVFCRIVEGEEKAYIVYEDRDILVILDKYPISKGHLLVIPKDHYESIVDAPREIVRRVFEIAWVFAKIYRERLQAPGVRVLTNSGRQAGQDIFHFHVHVIPYWSRFTTRGVLTRREAKEVLAMLDTHKDILRILEQ